jgi:hypothetical protein
LLHTEPVLLIDHHQAKSAERHAFLKQRVGAHCQASLTAGQPLASR